MDNIVLRLLLSALVVSQSRAHLDLFMPKEETKRIIGVDAEVYYVYNGSLMQQALLSSLHIPARIDGNVLAWRNRERTGSEMHYSIDLRWMGSNRVPSAGLHPPKLNISHTGTVPKALEYFQLSLRCTGETPSVDITVNLSVVTNGENNATSFILHRKKVCYSAVSWSTPGALMGQTDINYNLDISGNPLPEKRTTFGEIPKPTSTEIFYVAVGVASAIIILVAIVIFILYMRTRRQALTINGRPSVIGSSHNGTSITRHHNYKNSSSVSLPSSQRDTIFSSYCQLLPVITQSSLAAVVINRKSVTLGDVLLQGTFGRLYTGLVYVQDESEACYEQTVLVKTVTEEAVNDQVKPLLLEGALLQGLNHQCIGSVIAACLDTPPLLIYPYCEKGNLKILLQKSRRLPELLPVLNTQQLVLMGVQAATGLHYLHRKKLVHRDIAARNCLVDADFHVKISDSGLARDLFPDDYCCVLNNETKPIQWMALETLLENKYTFTTDVWSFGVLLWELVTFAQQPYSGVDECEMASYLLSGYRLLQPQSCPDELFAVMAYCWAVNPHDRPNLTQILACLQEFYNTLSRFI